MPTANIFIQSVVLFLQNYYFFFILPNIKSRTLQFSSFCRQNVKTKFSALQFKIGISTHCYLLFIAHVFTFFSTLQRNRILITMQFAPNYSAICTWLQCNQHPITMQSALDYTRITASKMRQHWLPRSYKRAKFRDIFINIFVEWKYRKEIEVAKINLSENRSLPWHYDSTIMPDLCRLQS